MIQNAATLGSVLRLGCIPVPGPGRVISGSADRLYSFCHNGP